MFGLMKSRHIIICVILLNTLTVYPQQSGGSSYSNLQETMSSKIPKLPKFTGDTNNSFATWIAQFEAQCSALGVATENRKQILICCLDSTAFSLALETSSVSPNGTYDELKETLKQSFCGDDYKRNLESVLRNLIFRRGENIHLYKHKLISTIKELYGVTDANAVNNIAINHVVANIDESARDQVRILQLAGNANLTAIVPDNHTIVVEGLVRGRTRNNMFRSALIESEWGTAA